MSEQFGHEHYKLLIPGLRLFNAQKYWECHEALEDLWINEPGEIRYVYWAIIQVAAAMIHYRESNLIGAWGLTKKAQAKFSKIRSENILDARYKDLLSWDELEEMVVKLNAESPISAYQNLFQFRFKENELWK